MTAEVAILNRSAVALAADSAVTIGKQRVWKSANKLFSLSSCNDIGIMIYGAGDYCGVPWEVVIKQFRKSIGQRTFKTLTECTDSFHFFLDNFSVPDEDISQLNFYFILLNAIAECRLVVDSPKVVDQRRQFVAEAERLAQEAEEIPIVLPDMQKADFAVLHKDMIKSFLQSQSNLHVTNNILSAMVDLSFERVRRQVLSRYETGVVFAGFGEQEIMPILEEWIVDGKYGDKSRAWKERRRDLNVKDTSPAYILPFGQSDIAFLFMEGLQINYLEFIESTLNGVLEEKSARLIKDYVPESDRIVETARQSKDNSVVVASFLDEFDTMRTQTAINPILDVVASLPKEEMAAMAEALVEITSLRRKIDSRLESVGGPVDVALISKSDGFVWIKRKHYFKMELNHDFLVRRQRRFEGVTS